MNRRDFTRMALLAMLGTGSGIPLACAADNVPIDPNLIAIFSDTHIPSDPASQQVLRFQQCARKVLAMNPRPANLLIYGDLACSVGLTRDYEKFRELMKPIEEAGIRWEATMGNHDRITNYRKIFPERFTGKEILPNRCVHIVETPKADFILLDSYLKGQIRGAIDEQQKAWLAETVKKRTGKPFFVGCHHGLAETQVGEILRGAPGFASYIHGHNHWWQKDDTDGIPSLCLPATGHWGDMGFVLAHITDKDAVFVPDIDACLLPGWLIPKQKTDIETYLKVLNKTAVTIPFTS